MGQEYKEFQSKLAITNTAMINLKLDQRVQIDVRHNMFKNQPTLQFQNTIKEFLSMISPSMQQKVKKALYEK
jgi:hypothetical protein